MLTSPSWEVRERSDCADGGIYYVSASIPELNWRLVGHFGARSGLRQFEEYVRYGLVTALATLVVLILLALNLSRRLAAPLDKLTRVARRISAGRHNERLPAFKESYAQEVGEAFNTMMDALEKQQQAMIQISTLSRVGEMNSSLVHEMRNSLSSSNIISSRKSTSIISLPALREPGRRRSLRSALLPVLLGMVCCTHCCSKAAGSHAGWPLAAWQFHRST